MKTKIAALIFTSLCASSSFALSMAPVVTKVNASGYTMAEYARYERCEVYMDKVVIHRTFGASEDIGFTLTETTPITLSPSVLNIVDKADKEELEETPNNLCDGPGSVISAARVLPNDAVKRVVIFSTGGCGSPSQVRQGPAARMLSDLVATYCPNTHTMGMDN